MNLREWLRERRENVRKSLVLGERGAARLQNNLEVLENLHKAKEMLGVSTQPRFEVVVRPDGKKAQQLNGGMENPETLAKWNALDRERKLRIKAATGWEVGRDGLWRKESAELNSAAVKRTQGTKRTAAKCGRRVRGARCEKRFPRVAEIWYTCGRWRKAEDGDGTETFEAEKQKGARGGGCARLQGPTRAERGGVRYGNWK